ncbi:MAG: hypothetical protein HHJ10_08930 [Cellulomonas sp.]|uniref:DUF6603 domain-containing protein n=1 Tax=Cellulomonas sp. TaxID=40001 RepID=UPI00183B3A6D|nr:DUF6603 domain-containing protein [Cellulomonas sp.]NMM31148.1 hypothetical protein [Cellulomonas sp.]
MSDDGTLQQLAGAVTAALRPLQTRLAAGDARGLIADMGLRLPTALDGLPAFTTATGAAITAVEALAAPVAALATAVENDDVGGIISATTALLAAIAGAISTLDAVASALGSLAGSLVGVDPGDVTSFAATFGEKLLEQVVVDYLAGYRPVLLRVLGLLGVVNLDSVPADAIDPAKIAHQRHDLTLGNLGTLLSDPGGYLAGQYGWSSPTLDTAKLLGRLREVLVELGAKAGLNPATGALDVYPFTLGPTTTANPPGLSAVLALALPGSVTLPLPSLLPSGWILELKAAGALQAGVEIRILPPGQLEVHASAIVDGQLRVAATRAPAAGKRLTIVGIPGIATFDAASVGITTGAHFHWDAGAGVARGAFVVGIVITGGTLRVGSANADGFVDSLLGGLDLEADLDLELGWAGDRGLYIGGNAGIGTTIGVHATVGPFTLDSIRLALTAGSTGLGIETSVSGHGTLGPISASVDRMGAITTLGFSPGNLGPAQLDVVFKPPSGLGVVVDAGIITGGGYISYDAVKGEYAGVLELSMLGISIKAIAVLDTRLPDGSSGFSFLIILTFDLPPIQLGFGFTLNGLGGLAGINRTMVLDALRDTMRAHHLDSILFPPDPVRDAPQIISDIRTIFPPAKDRYVFGPMLKVGWGTPTLISLEIGVILEVPDPVRIALLGRLHMALPDDDVALILIQIDILGTIDTGAKLLSIDGSMYDSHILIFELLGDMALRLYWGDNPDFAVSLGGFHPRFRPPAGFPTLRRLTVSIGDGDNPRLSCTSYMAVTSNSYQFGASVELFVAAGGFSVHGYIGFDALFIFSPFSFDIEFSAGVEVKYDGATLLGIHLDAELSGPNPWHVHGHASLEILFFSISMTVDVKWGDDHAISLPAAPVIGPLTAALIAPSSWSAQLPPGAEQAVTLRGGPVPEGDVVVHPMGSLTVREKIVPLGVPVTKFGNATPADGSEFSIAAATLGANPAALNPVQDYFARAQFQDMPDADKISAPAFERFQCGVQVGDPAVRGGHDAARTVTMQERYVVDPTKSSTLLHLRLIGTERFTALTARGAGARSAVTSTGTSKYVRPDTASMVSTADIQYVVAGTDDLAIRLDLTGASGTTSYGASVALTAHLLTHPEDLGRLQVLPVHEVAA